MTEPTDASTITRRPQGSERSDSLRASDSDDVRLLYSTLLVRAQHYSTLTWQVVSMSVAAEAGLWVALAQVKTPLFQVLIGLGLLMMGGVASLVIRYLELSSTLDRQLLGLCEQRLRIEPQLRTFHNLRFEDRLERVSAALDQPSVDTLFKRRIAKDLPARADGRLTPLWRVDRLLSTLGQPTVMFTAVLASSGVIGFSSGIYQASGRLWLAIPLAMGSLVLLALPWLASMKGRIGRGIRSLLADALD